MWQSNPINWTNLAWLKTAIVGALSQQKATLSYAELEMLREALTAIADDHSEHRDYAMGLLHQLPTGSGLILAPSQSNRSLDFQLQRILQEEQRLWWEVYYFLAKFEETPRGRIITARPPQSHKLADLAQQVQDGNAFAIPDYIWTHLQKTGIPPNLYFPHIHYYCSTHQRHVYPGGGGYTHAYRECPKTIEKKVVDQAGYTRHVNWPSDARCNFTPELYGLDNLISDMRTPNNLFATKKNVMPQPTSTSAFLSKFFQLHQKDPAYLLFPQEVEDYFRKDLADPVEVIAAMNVLPPIPRYPIVPISWDELIKQTNLNLSLITFTMGPYGSEFNRNHVSFMLENFYPLTILYFSGASKDRYGHYDVTNIKHGITIDGAQYWGKSGLWGNTGPPTKKARLYFSTFG